MQAAETQSFILLLTYDARYPSERVLCGCFGGLRPAPLEISGEMDRENLIRALHATTSSANQKEAAAYLEQNTRLLGFTPLLLHIIMDEGVDGSARQAAVIYLKNIINRHWITDEDDKQSFTLPEQDKHLIRELIIEAIVASPEAIRVQLCTAVGIITRHDFPKNWLHLPQKVATLLHSVDGPSWLGALLVIRRLVKLYEYRRVKEKKPLVETMSLLMPVLLERLITLMPDASQESCLLQKLILKIFYGLVQFSLNLEMFTVQSLTQWLEQFRLIIGRTVPEEVNTIDKDDRERTVWWKCKKWASAIVERIFERYGSPGQVQLNYSEFAENYMAHFAIPILNTCLQVLDGYRNGNYVSSRVLHSLLQYIDIAVSQSRTWKVIKPHCQGIVRSVLFPLLKFSDEDEELWNDSPEEFVRIKYGHNFVVFSFKIFMICAFDEHDAIHSVEFMHVYDELHNPTVAASNVLTGFAKRKDMLQPILEFALNMLSASNVDPCDQEGALRILGELFAALTRSKKYSSAVDELVERFIIPKIAHPVRFIRSRACWTVRQFASGKLSGGQITRIYEELVKTLANAMEELPVKVEAAMAIQHMLEAQTKYRSVLKPHVHAVIIEVLRLVARAEIEEMTSVMEVLLEDFVEDIIPIAVDVATELAKNQEDDRTVTVMGILTTLGSVLDMVEDNQDVLHYIEEQVRRVIKSVLEREQIDYYEEILALANSVITCSISEPMWEIFFDIHKLATTQDGMVFVNVMPLLHSYLTVDTDGFLARPERLRAFVEIAVNMFSEDMEENDQVHAAKLLECLILECQGKINNLVPDLVQLVLTRLHQPIEDCKTLKPALLLVVIAGLYYDADMFMSLLPQLQPHGTNTLNYLVNELLSLAHGLEGVHDRKMAVIGLCTMIRLPVAHRPTLIDEKAQQVNDLLVSLLIGLQKAMKIKAENRLANGKESDDKEIEEEFARDEDLADSEDEIDEDILEYLETLAEHQNKKERTGSDGQGFESNSSSASASWDEDSMEAYFTPLDNDETADVFIFYKETLDVLKASDEKLFCSMTTCTDTEKQVVLDGVLRVCEQRMSLAKSRKVEQQGGYAFNVDAPVPDTFNFAAKHS
uniref:Importin N-terminal domain-containing protein n=1 Tax=Setaria digitata TaxID=48799 RepID=A0A915Q402_9BILA